MEKAVTGLVASFVTLWTIPKWSWSMKQSQKRICFPFFQKQNLIFTLLNKKTTHIGRAVLRPSGGLKTKTWAQTQSYKTFKRLFQSI